jgi:hypothetical protein
MDPIEKARRKLEEQMVKRKTQRVARLKAEAPPPDERPKVLLIVKPRAAQEAEEDSFEALMARRLAEARRRLKGL